MENAPSRWVVQEDILCHIGGMDAEPKGRRVPIMMSVAEVRAVDAWRRKLDDLPSRSEAIRRLVDAGLKTLGAEAKPRSKKGRGA